MQALFTVEVLDILRTHATVVDLTLRNFCNLWSNWDLAR